MYVEELLANFVLQSVATSPSAKARACLDETP